MGEPEAKRGLQSPTTGDEAAFLRDMFVYGGEYYMGLPGSVRRDDRYEVQSSHLAARYNTWLAERGRDPVSNKRFAMQLGAYGAPYGIERERTSQCTNFVFDVPRLRAAMHGREPFGLSVAMPREARAPNGE